MRKHVLVLLVAVAALVPPLASRADSSTTIVSPPGGYLTSNAGAAGVVVSAGYAPALVVVSSQTGALVYENLDIQRHNFISDATTTDPATWDPRYCEAVKLPAWHQGDALPPCALFQDWSPTTDASGSRNFSESAPVLLTMPNGAPKLQTGTPYSFYCAFHPGMKGTLIVLPA
jgi:plastocyanin